MNRFSVLLLLAASVFPVLGIYGSVIRLAARWHPADAILLAFCVLIEILVVAAFVAWIRGHKKVAAYIGILIAIVLAGSAWFIVALSGSIASHMH